MVKSLRGRLLSSYVFVIATVLVITGLALILVVGSPLGNTARLLPTLQNLQTISRASARLLTDQVRYKDIGLVIIDEEQRFGVEHKDALKKLKE